MPEVVDSAILERALEHHRAGRLPEADLLYRDLLARDPNCADALHLLGVVAHQTGRHESAVELMRRAATLAPDNPAIYSNLGNLFNEQGQLDEAQTCLERALALDPYFAEAHTNLGNLLKYRGQLDDALACYRRALVLWPERADIHSNLVLGLYYRPVHETGAIEAEQRRWNEHHAQPLAQSILPYVNDRSPDRRLRIGYVSPDFCDHVVGLNLLSLLQRHRHEHFEVFCYAHVMAPDHLTEKFRACADRWHDIVPLAEADLAELVRRERIDILVDLALHTAKNRLLAFARKPAPVQVSFAGYPGGTGMEAIDYHLTDPYLEPPGPGHDRGADAPWRLPDSFWCYEAQSTGLPVKPLPASANGHLTFGCLNHFCKVNDAVLRLWTRVVSAIPGSRLLLLASESSHRRRILEVLASAGVHPDRVEFVSRQPRLDYLALYQRIDLGLDTFPYNGHTTSLDSYWMGVPVVTLVGPTVVGRAGWSQLSNLGLTELAARTEDEFVRIACTLARDLPRLAGLRAGLRTRMQCSPLMDAPRFTLAIEDAYRTMWREWCARPAPTTGPAA